MRLEATNKNVRGGLNKPPPLPGRVKRPKSTKHCHSVQNHTRPNETIQDLPKPYKTMTIQDI